MIGIKLSTWPKHVKIKRFSIIEIENKDEDRSGPRVSSIIIYD